MHLSPHLKALIDGTAVFSAVVTLFSCNSIDDDRIPAAAVNITFSTAADWNIYGVAGAMDYKYFILSKREPSNFPYLASSATGFGGVLLVSNVMGEPMAYDMACPVECKSSVVVRIDKEIMQARCPECGSTYDVFSLMGHPTGGPAATGHYGLRRFYVGPGRGGAYMVVTF